MKTAMISAAAVAAVACAGPLRAHHSASMFDLEAPVWLKGTVVDYSPINPHAMIVLEQPNESGQMQRWTVEGPSLNGLERMGVATDLLKAGDVIEVCGFPFKEEAIERIPAERRGRIPPQMPGASQRPALHGHVLVIPNGKMRRWGSYGKLQNCVRAGDEAQAWADFVNTDPAGRAAWCNSKALVRLATLPPKELVDEVDRRMTEPCD